MKRALRGSLAALVFAVAARSVAGCAAEGGAGPDALAPSNLDAAATSADAETSEPTPDGGADGEAPVPPCSVDGWCYTTLPAANSFDAGGAPADPSGYLFSLQAVWVAPDHHAWAVSAGGHVLHWNGTAWSLDFIARAGLRSVWGASASDVWLAGDAGLLLHGTGTPLTFQPVALGTAQDLTRVWGTSATDIWVLADRVYHLDATTAAKPSPFALVDVPSDYGAAVSSLRVTAVWGKTPDETWFGGNESTFCAPPNCVNGNQLFAARRKTDGAGNVSWSTVAFPIEGATALSAGVSTNDGLQVLTVKGHHLTDDGYAVRVADDASKLDPKRGVVTVAGAHAWNVELAESYGLPEGLWGHDGKDLWLVGESGVVRHFDGAAWQLSRVARTKVSPLVDDLHGIDAVVDATGARDMWVVGDDVALHRVTP